MLIGKLDRYSGSGRRHPATLTVYFFACYTVGNDCAKSASAMCCCARMNLAMRSIEFCQAIFDRRHCLSDLGKRLSFRSAGAIVLWDCFAGEGRCKGVFEIPFCHATSVSLTIGPGISVSSRPGQTCTGDSSILFSGQQAARKPHACESIRQTILK